MPQIRKLYLSGQVAVVSLPEIYREQCRMVVGDSLELSLHTARSILREMGVAETIIEQMPLGDRQFILIDKHVE